MCDYVWTFFAHDLDHWRYHWLRTGPELRVLILGTGPVAAQPHFQCPHGGSISTTSCDAFSRLYRELAKESQFRPPYGFPEKLGEQLVQYREII